MLLLECPNILYKLLIELFIKHLILQECQRLIRVVNKTLKKIVYIQHEHGHNEALLLDEKFDNPAFLSDESTEKIREESQYLKSYEMQINNYIKRRSNVKKEV